MTTPESSKLSGESAPTIAFISGHIDITHSQFLTHYQPSLDTAIAASHTFILSTAKGADTFALEYLLSHNVDPSNITVYIAQPGEPRKGKAVDVQKYVERGLRVEIVAGWHAERDAAMTRDSGYDVLWVRPEEETRVLYGRAYREGRVSGTERNLWRREVAEGVRKCEGC